MSHAYAAYFGGKDAMELRIDKIEIVKSGSRFSCLAGRSAGYEYLSRIQNTKLSLSAESAVDALIARLDNSIERHRIELMKCELRASKLRKLRDSNDLPDSTVIDD